MKRFRVFAGPNGSGKSSLVQKIADENLSLGYFINADRIQKELLQTSSFDFSPSGIEEAVRFKRFFDPIHPLLLKSGIEIQNNIDLKGSILRLRDFKSNNYFSGAIAQFLVDELLTQSRTFSYETVMSDLSKLEMISHARKSGFKTYLYFTCTESPEINIGRIDQRVAQGGHDVADETVIKRYTKTLENLLPAIKLSDRAFLFDNSIRQRLFLEVSGGTNFLVKSAVPEWFSKFIVPKLKIQ